MIGDVLVSKADLWTGYAATLRAWVRIPHSDDDEMLIRLAETAEKRIMQRTNWVLTQETRKLMLSGFPTASAFTVPRMPLVSVSGITYTTAAGTQTLAVDQYEADVLRYPGRVVLTAGNWWPEDVLYYPPIQVTYTVGWGDLATVMPDLLQCVQMFVAFWYENREAGVASTYRRAETAPLPYGVDDLLEGLTEL